MLTLLRIFTPLAVLAASISASAIDRFVPLREIPLDDLASFQTEGDNWTIGGGVVGPMRTSKVLEVFPGTGVLATAREGADAANLITVFEHGDLELSLDFILPKDGNSGVYLQGRYEVQLRDSWLNADPGYGDLGGIYQRWNEETETGFEGHAPASNAARAPGLWQNLQVKFRAPRFDEEGRKLSDAVFERVLINGQLVQENVTVTGSTRAAWATEEVARGPLMLQGDHGPVAFRNIRYKRTEAGEVTLGPMDFAWYPGAFIDVNDLDITTAEPLVQGETDLMDPTISGESGQGLLVLKGTIEVPASGDYGFQVTAGGGATQVSVDGEIVSHVWSNPAGVVNLTPGTHLIETKYIRRWGGGEPDFSVAVEGPEMAPQLLSVQHGEMEEPPEIGLDVEDRTLVQRGFVKHAGIMRLSGVSVGTPRGLHYAYDLAGGAPLKVWRGNFLDMTKMWHHRGEDQIAIPRGGAIELVGVPTLSQLPSSKTPWPTHPEPALRQRGYTRDAGGRPTFTTQLGPLVIADQITPLANGAGLHRELTLQGRSMNHNPRLMIAASSSISQDSDGTYVIGEREYYLEWLGARIAPPERAEDESTEPVPNIPEPVIRESAGRMEMTIEFPHDLSETKSVGYNLIW